MKQKKADNKGFSLVELIIVIAIMAILVGIVGTQVVPYIEKSKEAKDLQIISSYSTAGMTAYSANAKDITAGATYTVDVYSATVPAANSVEEKLLNEVKTLTSTSCPTFASKKYKDANIIKITFASDKITAQAYKNTTALGEVVESKIN